MMSPFGGLYVKLNKILSTNDILKKEVIMAVDFNMNLLDFKQNKKVQNLMFGHSMTPVIDNRPVLQRTLQQL